MKISQISAIAAGGILLGVSFGCVSQQQYTELDSKVKEQQKLLQSSIKVQQDMLAVNSMQQKMIEELSRETKTGFEMAGKAIDQLAAKMKEKPTSEREKLVDAAILLAKRGPSNSRYNSINVLGSIGGEKAENALLEMLETEQNYKNHVFQALQRMNSSKLRTLVFKTMENPTGRDFSNISSCFDRNNNVIFTRKDIPAMEKYLNRMPPRGNYAHYRSAVIGVILTLDTPKGIDLICREIMLNPSRNNNLFYQLNNHNITISIADWKKILNALGPICSANINSYQAICQAIRSCNDIRMTDVVLPWAEFAKNNMNFRNSYLEMLINLKDPKAAPVIVEMQNTAINDYQKRRMRECPGVVEKDGKLVLADKAEMEKLMAQREKTVAGLNALDKKRAEILKK